MGGSVTQIIYGEGPRAIRGCVTIALSRDGLDGLDDWTDWGRQVMGNG